MLLSWQTAWACALHCKVSKLFSRREVPLLRGPGYQEKSQGLLEVCSHLLSLLSLLLFKLLAVVRKTHTGQGLHWVVLLEQTALLYLVDGHWVDL